MILDQAPEENNNNSNAAERDRSCRLAPSGECKRNIIARRFCLHRAFKHALLLRIPLCVSWAFLV